MINYVQVDENNVVVGVSMLKGRVEEPYMIEVGAYDESLVGKRYEDGEFIDVPPEESSLTYEEERARYISLIRDAKDLGEDSEVERLQLEWASVKTENGW